MIIGGVFARPDAYVAILAMLYIVDVDLHDLKHEKKNSSLETLKKDT